MKTKYSGFGRCLICCKIPCQCEEKKNIQEWAKLEGYIILDPDGFDRTRPDVMTKLITKKEFDAGWLRCTIEKIKETPNDR
jgi:hypothetical protein